MAKLTGLFLLVTGKLVHFRSPYKVNRIRTSHFKADISC